MLRGCLALLISTTGLMACSSDSDKKANSISPLLTVKAINDQCLDLQSVVAQMESPGFDFPGFVYTRDFQILNSSARREYANSLLAKSFRAENANFRGLAEFRGLQQQGCETVTLTDFGGKPVTYNITSSSKNHLELELDKEALGASLEEMSVHHKKQLTKTPMVKKFILTVKSPTEIDLVSVYDAIPSECYKTTSLSVREELVYGWANSSAQIAQSAQVKKDYWAKLNELAKLPVVEQPVEQPIPEEPIPEEPIAEQPPIEVPTPIPAPPEQPVPQAISAQSLEVDGNFETLNLASRPSTITALQSYAHPHCF